MTAKREASEFFREYDLVAARTRPLPRSPSPHQDEALRRLGDWFGTARPGPRGGVLVIPTGGGKTFTASHFLCRYALSDGFKVLWLAHTHHLLEQAAAAVGDVAGLVAEPKSILRVRVVSATPGHFPVHAIRPADDVVVSTLQTAANAVARGHERLAAFLAASDGSLAVVFDEAHHAPAPSYRKLLVGLRVRFPRLRLLGLTATPTHADPRKHGWFHELFPQGILYQVSPRELMAAGVLARPVFEEAATRVVPAFDEAAYQAWVGTNRDLPEEIIERLAKDQARNDLIGQHYVDNRGKYGKTIVFADRWYQCEYLREWLRARGVRAGAVYSHADRTAATVEARRRRAGDENATTLGAFRRGDLDVLLNVRMLTEGTDVPDVRTVFLTRQTTSRVLLTQMVGRALRGPQFGGTPDAYVVAFIDQWRQQINWAGFDPFAPGALDVAEPAAVPRPPVRLISVELVRRLARQMDAGPGGVAAPAAALLPVGWYPVEYDARATGSEDVEPERGFVMVFSDEQDGFARFVADLTGADLSGFESEAVELGRVRDRVDRWAGSYFPAGGDRVGGGLADDLFRLARHAAQNDGEPPAFFAFEARAAHDLDAVAAALLAANLTRPDEEKALRAEFARADRFWPALYRSYERFKTHYRGCVERALAGRPGAGAPYTTPEAVPFAEPDDALKDAVKARDGFRCLCCGRGKPHARLQVDHVEPAYHGGPPVADNLQTLCSVCNRTKGVARISFRVSRTPLTFPPAGFTLVGVPSGAAVRTREGWQACLRGSVNLYFRCAAAARVEVGIRGEYLRTWRVELFPGNDATWLRSHYQAILAAVHDARRAAGVEVAPDQITFS